MKWIRRALVLLVSLPMLAVVGLLLAGQRETAGRNTERLAIARPPSEVYRHLVDPELLRRWSGLAEIRLLGEAPVQTGSRLKLVSEARGQRTSMEAEVMAAEPGRRLTIALRTDPGAAVGFSQRVEYRLEERDGDTRLSVTADTSYDSAVARLLEPVITRSLQQHLEATLEALRAQVEAQPASRSDATPSP